MFCDKLLAIETYKNKKSIKNLYNLVKASFRYGKLLTSEERITIEELKDFASFINILKGKKYMYRENMSYTILVTYFSSNNSRILKVEISNTDKTTLTYVINLNQTDTVSMTITDKSNGFHIEYYNGKQIWGLEESYISILKKYILEFSEFVMWGGI